MKDFKKKQHSKTYPFTAAGKSVRITVTQDLIEMYVGVDVLRSAGLLARDVPVWRYDGKLNNGEKMIVEKRNVTCWTNDGRIRGSNAYCLNEPAVKMLLHDLGVPQDLYCFYCEEVFPVGKSYAEFYKKFITSPKSIETDDSDRVPEKTAHTAQRPAATYANDVLKTIDDLILSCIILKKSIYREYIDYKPIV